MAGVVAVVAHSREWEVRGSRSDEEGVSASMTGRARLWDGCRCSGCSGGRHVRGQFGRKDSGGGRGDDVLALNSLK